ncbi:MAG: glucose-6-phosphate dehydrogenase [Acidimicrobiia bacterium]|nr:glucose-6-phosphate dehydrogenase [Acidimicrobiia bacterium]
MTTVGQDREESTRLAQVEALTADVEPHLVIIFGGSGDLAHRKLLPALYELLSARNFIDKIEVLAVATTEMTDEQYRASIAGSLREEGMSGSGPWCKEFLHYQAIGDGFEVLAERIRSIETASGLTGNRVFYLAIPPHVFDDTIQGLGDSGLSSGPGETKVVIEKPFGDDLASANRLNQVLFEWFDEDQIYRIDHYLAKETVQNLMALRFGNPIFETSWNRMGIESVQITFEEDIGIGSRGKYFDGAGMIRDVIQNHLLQVLTIVAMDSPVRLDEASIRDEKVKVLRAISELKPNDVVRGQYRAADGEVGYLEESNIPPDSVTETYAALRLEIDNWRWQGVPFYIRAGKRLEERLTKVTIVFHGPPVALFSDDVEHRTEPNILHIILQPNEGFDLRFQMKAPGEGYDLVTGSLGYRYKDSFAELPPAYETLLADVLLGDQTLFVRYDEVEEAWRIVDAILDLTEKPHAYDAGSSGPSEADQIPAKDGYHWV